ncbi:choice-of-anchor I family protein [Anabaena sp. UHCC 0451]|uniref:choice-of-anchor I family protein n=1 Tax=Anabaena sp. UHCC 0451 TaxID=2055235 RepID=UPI002B2023F0|nr:choice-of-anchor I family protein [Anabaena sp. UHCC 0451]MEA5576822.1 choice-of-anchor I family protein [Anabaena sp. UHCC 0451]
MTNSIQLNHIGTVSLNGAEISDFDPKSQRLFVTGEFEGKPVLQVVDAADPTQPIQINEIDLSSLGAGIQSVAVRKGTGSENSIVAVAISANTSTDPGKVVFYDAVTLAKISEVTVGALPDMITFTPDGSKLLVANEGEPNEDYTVDPEGSVSIIDVSGDIATLNDSNVTTADFTAFNGQEATLKAAGVRIFGLNATVAQDLEPEYIAVSPDNQTAVITLQDNNAIAVLDIANGTISSVLPLGFKDHSLPGNGLDASDRDGGINIENRPVFGMYQPDAISSFQVGGVTYYITANEGDARIRPTGDNVLPAPNDEEGDIFNEETRIKDIILDPTAFPNAAELQADANLGRLLITNTLGDTDGDGDFDKLYAYGARSFSIWDGQGNLVFDSGDQLERITAAKAPSLFNANNGSPDDVDTRSDNKGPEPESVAVGVIDGIPYGFIGLERAGGGVMVYNLSDPTAPEFIQYIRNEGDISPEGLKFIAGEDSPNGKPLLAVSHEVSNTASFYEINPAPQLTTYEFQDLPLLGTTSAGDDIFLGGFSGLYFQGLATNGNLQFVTHTDRGPNGEPTGQNRPFLLPDFQPEIVSFELNQTTDEITITNRTGLFREDGTTPLTGLPNLQAGAGGTAYTDEIGVDLNGQVLPNDTLGADLEGIVIAPNGDYWMVDEYRPAIYHFDVNGKLLDRFIPQGTATATDPDQTAGTFGTEVLPAVYAQRRNNRGFEAVALEGNKLYAFIQSAIDNPDVTNDATSRNSRNLRILEFDVVSKTVTGEYLYLLDDITGTGNSRTDKIGDAVSLGNGKFAVVERDDRSDNTSNKLIYQIDLATATNIHNPANFTLPADKTIEQLTLTELTAAGITSVSKSLIVNAAEIGYTGVEKLEGLALVSPNTLALINDNDFGVAGPTPVKLGIIDLPNSLPVANVGFFSFNFESPLPTSIVAVGFIPSNPPTRVVFDPIIESLDGNNILRLKNELLASDGGFATSVFNVTNEVFEDVKVSALFNPAGDSNDQIGVMARVKPSTGSSYVAAIDFSANRLLLSKVVGQQATVLASAENILPSLDQAYFVELEVIGNKLTSRYFDASGTNELYTLMATDTDNPLVSGFSALVADISTAGFPLGNDNNDSTFDNFSSRSISVPESSNVLVTGTPGADILIAGVDFDGVNNIVFTGAGNDEVDVPFGGSQAGNNRIFTGSGTDIIYVGDGDRSFGGSGDDELDATDATGYRLSGGTGNDIFYLGADGRALGGDGDDQFYVQEGGGNILAGGAGADQFWILTGDLPSAANTILDFEMGTDVLGIAGQGAGFDFTDLTLSGNSIMVGSTTIAMLNGIDTTSLTAANFAFM